MHKLFIKSECSVHVITWTIRYPSIRVITCTEHSFLTDIWFPSSRVYIKPSTTSQILLDSWCIVILTSVDFLKKDLFLVSVIKISPTQGYWEAAGVMTIRGMLQSMCWYYLRLRVYNILAEGKWLWWLTDSEITALWIPSQDVYTNAGLYHFFENSQIFSVN